MLFLAVNNLSSLVCPRFRSDSMPSQTKDGRQYLLEQLDEMEKDPALQQKIIQSMFEKNDRIDQSTFGTTTEVNPTELNKNCMVWAMTLTKILDVLREDMELAKRLARDEWDDTILKDALQLLRFLLNVLTDPKLLKNKCEEKARDNPVHKVGSKAYRAIYEELEHSQDRATNCFDSLLVHLTSGKGKDSAEYTRIKNMSSIKDEERISAATLRELLVRNEAWRMREDILQALKGASEYEEISEEHVKGATSIVGSLGHPCS